MDLITGLPHHQGFDAILTIVNHGCSWAAIFLPCTTTITSPRIAQLYMEHIYRWFRLPKKLISDRDPQFTSHFRHALCHKLGINQNLSTTFTPRPMGSWSGRTNGLNNTSRLSLLSNWKIGLIGYQQPLLSITTRETLPLAPP
jgi:hypothetical protein